MRFSWLQSLINRRPSRSAHRRRITNTQAEVLEQRQVLTMLAPVSVVAGSTVTTVEVGDFNSDGINDIAELRAALPGSVLSVLLGNGDGTFQAAVNSGAGSAASGMTLSDFDHDGKLDIVTNHGYSIDFSRGNGDGSFQLPWSYSVGAYANDVESADVNNDGFDDVLTASFSYGGTTQLFLNVGANAALNFGNGPFLNSRNLSIGVGGLDLEVGDLDGDGNLDLVQSAGNGGVEVMIGHGDGTFASPSYGSIGMATVDLQVGDFNHDGNADVAATSGSTIKIFQGNGIATFQSSLSYTVSGASDLRLADINGDGHRDIVANNGVAILGRGNGGFYAPTSYGSATGTALALGDFNDDGGIDAVAVSNSLLAGGGVSITLNGNNDVQLLAGATRLVVSSAGSATAGSPFAVTVNALDADGNVVTGFQGTVGISGAPGTQPVSYTFSAADGGVHTIANAATLFTAGSGSFSVTSPFLPDTSGTVDVVAAAAAKFTVVAQTTSVAGNAASVTVSAFDAYGNFASDYAGTVHFRSTDAQAGLPSDYTFTTDDAGTHTWAATLKTAGLQSVTASDLTTSTIIGTSGSITVTPAAAASLSVTGGGGFIGSVNAVRITARDAYGNVATGDNGVVHLASSDAASVTSADAALVNGVGIYTVTPMTLGSQTLTATDANDSTVGGSEVINVTPGWGARFVATPLSATVAGQTQNTTVTVYDSFGNVSTVYTGWVAVATSDPRAPLAYVYFTAADAGVKTIPVTLSTAGPQAVTISDYVNPGVTVTQTGITVTPASAASVSVTALHSATAGVAQSFTVTLRDAYGNVATGYRGTLNFTSGDKLAALPAAYTFTAADAGVHTFSLTFKSASGQDLTVTDSVNAAITSYQRDIVITPAAMTGFLLRAPSSATAGVAFNITVEAVDVYGNTVTGYTGIVHFSGAAGLPADYAFTAADAGEHVFSITLTSTGKLSLGVQDTVDGKLKSQTSVKIVAAPTSTGGGTTGGGGGGGSGGGGGGSKKVV